MKRVIAIVLVPLLLASLLSLAMIKGDLSGDGRIDLADAILSVQGLASSVDDDAGTSLMTSLSSAMAAFKAVAGLSSQIRDSSENSRTNQTTHLVLGPSSYSRIFLYELVAFIDTYDKTCPASTHPDRPFPPPEFA